MKPILSIAVLVFLAAQSAPAQIVVKRPFFNLNSTNRPPFHVYSDYQVPENHGAPSGWIGDYRDILMDANCPENPHSGKTCIKVTYTAQSSKYADWAGFFWQNPPNNNGDIDGGINLTGAKKLTFWARGAKGDEMIDAFKMGGTLGAYPDTDTVGLYNIQLETKWTLYEIDLSHVDTSYISGFFAVIWKRFLNPKGFVIYLDDIKIE